MLLMSLLANKKVFSCKAPVDGTWEAGASAITVSGSDVSGSDVYVAGWEGYVVRYWKNATPVNLTDDRHLAYANDIVVVK